MAAQGRAQGSLPNSRCLWAQEQWHVGGSGRNVESGGCSPWLSVACTGHAGDSGLPMRLVWDQGGAKRNWNQLWPVIRTNKLPQAKNAKPGANNLDSGCWPGSVPAIEHVALIRKSFIFLDSQPQESLLKKNFSLLLHFWGGVCTSYR